MIDYFISDNSLLFSEYISRSRTLIKEKRPDLQLLHLHQSDQNVKLIIDANSPFELRPQQPMQHNGRTKYGALLIHGLFDSPFSLRDIGNCLQANGILSRAILLPGHGTTPSDLLSVTYTEWLQTVEYGIKSLQHEVEHIFLIGYSTGATLALCQAFQQHPIAGMILFAPAIEIKVPASIFSLWQYLCAHFSAQSEWICQVEEINYAKYRSLPFNAVKQVLLLADVLKKSDPRSLNCPTFMIVSKDDETISTRKALDYFSQLPNSKNKLLLYASHPPASTNPHIITRKSSYASLPIRNFSHVTLPFSPSNNHYGPQGDYLYASHIDDQNEFIYGAYNLPKVKFYDLLAKMKLVKHRRRALRFNPDFEFMAERIVEFILQDEVVK